jgi:hypothetical protein
VFVLHVFGVCMLTDLVVVLLQLPMVCGDGFGYGGVAAEECRSGGETDGLRPEGCSSER